jgi:DNA-binding transcriptional regulator YiaG
MAVLTEGGGAMPDSPVVQALYEIPAEEVDPLRMWEVVQEHLSGVYEPVRPEELERHLAEMQAYAGDAQDLARGRSLNWKWMLGVSMVSLRRALDGESLTVIELTHTVSHALMARRWRVETLAYDRHALSRARFIGMCGRLMMQVAPDDWLMPLLTHPNGTTPKRPGLGERIRRRRNARGLSITELARRLDVSRTTVSRWETGVTVPHPKHRQALADLLGGDPSDYA